MIPFDLERFKQGDVALTRDGREAGFLYCDARLGDWPLGAIIEGKIAAFDVEGLYDTKDHPNDLVAMKPKTKTLYQWAYKTERGEWVISNFMMDEEEARDFVGESESRKTNVFIEVEA